MKNILVIGANGQLGNCIKRVDQSYNLPDTKFTYVDKEELDIIENEKLVIDRDKKKIDDLIKESIELESGNKDRINELNNSLCELKKEYDEIDTIVQEYQISFASLKESVKNLDQIIDNSNDELKKKLKM